MKVIFEYTMNWNILILSFTALLGISIVKVQAAHCNYPPKVSTCRSDDQGSIDVKHSHCFLKKTYTSTGVKVEKGGVNESECIANKAQSSINNYRCKLSPPPINTVCYDCCTAIDCDRDSKWCNENNIINPKYMPAYMKGGSTVPKTTSLPTTNKPTTTKATTPIPTTTKSTTHIPTTTKSTTPIPTTTKSTTPIPTTTKSTTHIPTTTKSTTYLPTTPMITTNLPTTKTTVPTTVTHLITTQSTPLTYSSTHTVSMTTKTAGSGTKCLVCTEYTNNTCSLTDHVECPVDKPYCLNEVIYSADGKRARTYHRCASKVECYWDYWVGTGNGTSCQKSGVCTYCCQSTGQIPCNIAPGKPLSLVKFDQQTQHQAHRCMVTDDHNGDKQHDCSDSEGRFCMNNVYYNIKTNIATRVERRCAQKDECKGKWLQSRKVDACLTGNTTGFSANTTNQILLCHYCCESSGNMPCNLKDRPDQIEQFIQHTTIAPKTTATTRQMPTTTATTTKPTPTTTATTTKPTPTTTATTTKPTPTTTVTTTKPTPTTTATTTKPTPTTTATIHTTTMTTTATTATTSAPRQCNQCGDPQLSIPCSNRDINATLLLGCPPNYDFCMTDVIHDQFGNADIFKRCATDHMCRKQWILETADQDYCKKYGSVNNPAPFQCHFCCKGDGCNTNIIPAPSTWYKVH